MKFLSAALAAPLMVLVQYSLLYCSLPGEQTLDLALLYVLAVALSWGAAGGTAMGLWTGTLLGAVRGGFSLPLACLYGAAGWLAGSFSELSHRRWLFPVVGSCLLILVCYADAYLGWRLLGVWPNSSWLLGQAGWNGLACLLLLAVPPKRKGTTISG